MLRFPHFLLIAILVLCRRPLLQIVAYLFRRVAAGARMKEHVDGSVVFCLCTKKSIVTGEARLNLDICDWPHGICLLSNDSLSTHRAHSVTLLSAQVANFTNKIWFGDEAAKQLFSHFVSTQNHEPLQTRALEKVLWIGSMLFLMFSFHVWTTQQTCAQKDWNLWRTSAFYSQTHFVCYKFILIAPWWLAAA